MRTRSRLRFCLVAFSVMCGGALATPANAAGQLLNAPPPGTSVDWSGLYLGVHGGYGWAKRGTDLGASISADGWLGGGHVGLQTQFDRWVFGIEASFTGGQMEGSTVVAGPASIKASISDILMITGRVGHTWSDLLLYVKGGYASADVDLAITSGGGTVASNSRLDGWTAGFGIERKLTHNLSFGIEYNYIDLGTKSFSFTGAAPVAVAALVVVPPKPTSGRLDLDGVHSIMARLSFRLGDDPVPVSYK